MAIYIRLFHGRKSPEETLDGWGEDGPVFGPYTWFHMAYFAHPAFGNSRSSRDDSWLTVVKDLIYYDGMYYGDIEIFEEASEYTVVTYDPSKSELPKKEISEESSPKSWKNLLFRKG